MLDRSRIIDSYENGNQGKKMPGDWGFDRGKPNSLDGAHKCKSQGSEKEQSLEKLNSGDPITTRRLSPLAK
jgi:hypothetical protein